jgi:hypothetical protein
MALSTFNSSFGIEKNDTSSIGNLTIPAICENNLCLPQIYASVPINLTQINEMSPSEVINLKYDIMTSFGNYLDKTFATIKSSKLIDLRSPYDICRDQPLPGCVGIRPPPPDKEFRD